MAPFAFPPEFLQQVRELALRWGKMAAEQAAQQIGTQPQIDFLDIEQFAALVAAGVTESTVATLVDKQAQTLDHEHPCPKCGTSCPLRSHDRPLTLETGQVVLLHEPIGHCPQCRRDFFPPPDTTATG